MSERPDPGAPPPVPRWVKGFGFAFLVLVLLFVGLHLAGGSFRHHGMPASQGTSGR